MTPTQDPKNPQEDVEMAKAVKCPRCGSVLSERAKPYQQTDLLLQTPQSVWQEYKRNGYTISEAIAEEMSYA